jgi:hypothetical protein
MMCFPSNYLQKDHSMKTDLLCDNRFSSSTSILLYGLMHNDFTMGDRGLSIHGIDYMNKRRRLCGVAKKEVESIGGELYFSKRGKKFVEVHFFIPKHKLD